MCYIAEILLFTSDGQENDIPQDWKYKWRQKILSWEYLRPPPREQRVYSMHAVSDTLL